MSLLNLFWQCRTDLKAHVIMPLCIEVSKQSRGNPGRKVWSKRDMWLKSPPTLQTPINISPAKQLLHPPLQTPTPPQRFNENP